MNLDDALDRLLKNDLERLCIAADGQLRAAESPLALLPGSFNPVHAGHWGLASAAARQLGVPVDFELSVANVDKPTLDLAEIRRRLQQFVGRASLWLTRAPRFVDKARLFPGTVFVVGADTAARIVAPNYYDDHAGVAEALEFMRSQGCRFLVAGRADTQGQFVGLGELAIPATASDLFEAIPPRQFRLDVSSSELRRDSADERHP